MKIHPDNLPNDVELLKVLLLEQATLLDKKDSQLVEWESKYQLILEQWRLAQQKQFGKSSEVSPGQGELFDESSTNVDDSIETERSIGLTIELMGLGGVGEATSDQGLFDYGRPFYLK